MSFLKFIWDILFWSFVCIAFYILIAFAVNGEL